MVLGTTILKNQIQKTPKKSCPETWSTPKAWHSITGIHFASTGGTQVTEPPANGVPVFRTGFFFRSKICWKRFFIWSLSNHFLLEMFWLETDQRPNLGHLPFESGRIGLCACLRFASSSVARLQTAKQPWPFAISCPRQIDNAAKHQSLTLRWASAQRHHADWVGIKIADLEATIQKYNSSQLQDSDAFLRLKLWTWLICHAFKS